MNLKSFIKSVHITFFFCLIVLPVAPCIQAQSHHVGEQPDQEDADPGVNPNRIVSLATQVDPVGGATVEELVKRALAKNAELLAARQRTSEAQGLLLQAGVRPNPGFEVSVTEGSILGSPGEREITLGYAHRFELGGKRKRRVEVAQLGAQLAQLELADRQRQLKAEVKARYGQALAAARNLEIAARLLDLNQQAYRIIQARVREGDAALLEQGLLQVEVNRIESDRLLLANEVARLILQLKTLAGMNLDEPLRLSGELGTPPVTISLAEATERALRTRPDLQAVRLEAKLADAQVRLARAEAIPDVTGFARYSSVRSRFRQFGLNGAASLVPIRETDNLFTAGVSITLPTRDRNQGHIQAAIARADAARLQRQFIEQVVQREVRAAYSRWQTMQQALAIFDTRVIGQSQRNLRTIRVAHDLGNLRLLDVINQQRRLIDTEKAYTELLKGYVLARVDLERAIGGPLR